MSPNPGPVLLPLRGAPRLGIPLSAAKAGEREGPIAKRWEGEVGGNRFELILRPLSSHLTRLASLATLSPAIAAERVMASSRICDCSSHEGRGDSVLVAASAVSALRQARP